MNLNQTVEHSLQHREQFWAEQAKLIDWHTPFGQVLDYSRPPFARWFCGGKTNLCHNAVDRHLSDSAEKPALIFVSSETNIERTYSFRELHQEVMRMSSIMLNAGVKQGDRVLIYMPMIAEAVFAMLACARIGAIHSVVFGGFASHSLATRIEDARPILIVSADAGSRAGKVVPYKGLLDEAIELSAHKPARVLMVNRGLAPMTLIAGRDLDYTSQRAREHERAGSGYLAGVQRSQLHFVHLGYNRKTQRGPTRRRRLCGRACGFDEKYLLRAQGRHLFFGQ